MPHKRPQDLAPSGDGRLPASFARGAPDRRTSSVANVPRPAIPDTLDDALDPKWLSAALGIRFSGVHISNVVPGPIVSRVSTNARFQIESEDGLPDGLPAELCIKGYFDVPAARAAGIPETFFYRELAELSGVRTLRSVYADVDPQTQHGVIITEDVAARGATFLDGTSDYSVEQTAASLTELAKLHAATWATDFGGVQWLAPHMLRTLKARGLKEIKQNFESEIGAGVPDDARDAQRLVDAYPLLAQQAATAQPWTVMHGDPHVGNVFLDADGQPSWLDWQLVQLGAWWIDVGYHIASALSVEDRRLHERELLKHYLSELAARGVEAPTWDESWLGLRRGVVQGFFLWGVTLKVAPQITASLLGRLGTAVSDHDSLRAVAEA
jgi:hypothetical protein